MFTPTILIVLAATVQSASLETLVPKWHTNYAAALKLAKEKGRPLAVVLGAGKEGFQRVVSEGKLGADVEKVLAQSYVCVYVDSDQPGGQKLASDFEMPAGLGLILSDRTGDLQAYRNEGLLESRILLTNLQKFANPDRVVSTTESNVIRQTSFYPSNTFQPISAPPVLNYPPPSLHGFSSQPYSFGSMSSRSC